MGITEVQTGIDRDTQFRQALQGCPRSGVTAGAKSRRPETGALGEIPHSFGEEAKLRLLREPVKEVILLGRLVGDAFLARLLPLGIVPVLRMKVELHVLLPGKQEIKDG